MNTFPWQPVKISDIADPEVLTMYEEKWDSAKITMDNRTKNYQFFTKIAHNQSLFDQNKTKKQTFSEGSTQAIKRKIRAQTIQRVPDGQVVTQYDKNSKEHVITEFIFKKKILTSEYDGKDMMKNLWKAFNASYDYGFACVVTGFERDLDGDVRISWTQIPYNDVKPSPDCHYIEEADWYIIRTWVPRSSLKALVDWDSEDGAISDTTYNADVVHYLLQEHTVDAVEPPSLPNADKDQGNTLHDSIEVRTLYCRGSDEFVSWVPSINAILRRVKNEDPRKDVPVHFLILEPDPEYPLGCSSVYWTLAQQQFADAFQTTSYRQLLLSANPPVMAFGNISYPTINMKPGALWNMGTNQNNRVEKFPIETTTLTQFGAVLENVSANMMRNLNITDATVASDANVATYSGTPQGVEQQRLDKTITINQYQKRVEIFFAEWANHALRSYISSMTGTVKLTVNEETRRRIWDIEMADKKAKINEDPNAIIDDNDTIIDGDKIEVDFDELSSDLLEFEVRAGSLIENEREQERASVQELILPLTQMLSGVSDENKSVFEHVIMMLVSRLCELSNIDIPMQTSAEIDTQLLKEIAKANMEAIMEQQQQLDQQGAAINQLMQQQPQAPMQGEGQMPMPGEGQMPMEQVPMEEQGNLPQGEYQNYEDVMPMPGAEQGAPQMPMPTPQGPEVSAEFPPQAPGAEVPQNPNESTEGPQLPL